MRVLQPLTIAVSVGVAFAGCNQNLPPEDIGDSSGTLEPTTDKQRDSKETISVRGLLEHFPQDVKSTEAWLGHEFMIGDTPIRSTEKVPRDTLMKMVGENVEVTGVKNAEKKHEPPKPEEETFESKRPTFPEGAIVIEESGVEASSIVKITD